MIKFNKPESLNGFQLVRELNSAGIKVESTPVVDEFDDLWLDIAAKDQAKATSIINKHIGIDEAIAKAEARQAIAERLGLTADELQVLLG